MIGTNPLITIGMPVFNGENFLREAINSILSQTFTNFELIISDNASTDRTNQICQEYMVRDTRIRYLRNKVNLGAAENYNRLVWMAKGKYFKWAAHDDLCAPEYLQKCVSILERDPTVMVAHTKTSIVDEYGRHRKDYNDLLDFRSSVPHERLRNYLFRPASEWNAIFGLVRLEELKETPLIGGYLASDQVLLGELVLRGKVAQVSDNLFFRRDHPMNSWRANRTRNDLAAWFNPVRSYRRLIPVKLLHLYEYLWAIHRVPLNFSNRLFCFFHMLKWSLKHLIWGPFKKKFVAGDRGAKKNIPGRQSGMTLSRN